MKILNIIVLLFVFILSDFLQPASGEKLIKPKNSETKTTLIVLGKNRTYYALSSKQPAVLNVKGPGKLKIITRIKFGLKAKDELDYSIYYRLDGSEKIKSDFKDVERDAEAKFEDGNSGTPGTGEKIIIELSRGEHSIEIWQEGENYKINARYLLTKLKEKKIDWVSLSPLYPNEPVSLVTGENVVSYYRFSDSKPLKVKITGPTVLRILSRVENHYYMKGRINYRLQVKEGDAIIHTYLLNSIRSDVTVYRKGCGRVPGKAKEIIIDVPKGTHVYKVIPLDKDKNTLLARILFPKKDVKIKE